MSIRMRLNRSKTGKRRSHHRLEQPRLSACANCGAMHVRHTMCAQCGTYRDRQVVDVAARAQKKQQKQQARQEALRQQGLAPRGGDEQDAQATGEESNRSQ